MSLKYGDVLAVFREYFQHDKKTHTDEQYGYEIKMQNKEDKYLGRLAFVMPIRNLLDLKFPRYMYFPLRSKKKEGCVHYWYRPNRYIRISKYIATRQIGNLSDDFFVRIAGNVRKKMNLARKKQEINNELNKVFVLNNKEKNTKYSVGDLVDVRFEKDTPCVVISTYEDTRYICVLHGEDYVENDEKLDVSTFVLTPADTGLEKKLSIRLYLVRTIDKRRVKSIIGKLDSSTTDKIVSKFMGIMERAANEV